MFTGMRRERSRDCISDLRFDQWRAGDAAAAEQQAFKAHLASCARCRERQEMLADARARFDASRLATPAWLSGSGVHAERPLSRRTRTLGLASLAAAAACALFMLPEQGLSPASRTKGNPYLTYYVKRGDVVLQGASAQVLMPADRIRFAYSTPRAQHLAILSLDATAHASVYYPDADQAAPIEPGTNVLLPSAIELDATLGQELIVAVFCEQPIAVAPLREALQARRTPLRVPPGCTTHQLQLTKQAAIP